MEYLWFGTSWQLLFSVLLSTIGIYLALIIFTRIAVLRTFSKISSFDFAVTVAFGSIIAGTILAKDPPLLQAIFGMGILYLIQIIVAKLRGNTTIMSRLVDNEPLLLMKGNKVLEENLKKAKVTHADLRAKLREANATQLSQVHAVVMEATGDIAVLHNDDPGHKVDDEILRGVRGWNG